MTLRSWKVRVASGLYDYLSERESVSKMRSEDSDFMLRIRGEAWGQGASLMHVERGKHAGKFLSEVGISRYTFNSLSNGYLPARTRRIIPTQNAKHIPGFDFTFSPPKSVSI